MGLHSGNKRAALSLPNGFSTSGASIVNTLEVIKRAAKRAPNPANANSVVVALDRYGALFGLDQPHRLAQYLPQLIHESAEFRYDREIWGPTAAQKRYEGRKDLGNTEPGDGKKFAGHTAIQITGKANTRAFRDWCRKFIDPKAPDFVAHPDLMNTDPWEGLGPIWYWAVGNPTGQSLNRYADQGDVENITVKINGGRNGFTDRLDYLVRVSLSMLGFAPTDVRGFQKQAGVKIDGDPGPKTRAALHQALVRLTVPVDRADDVQAAPVVEEKPVAVTPAALDKPVTQTSGFWERVFTIAGSIGIGGASWLGDWRVILAIAGTITVVALLGLLLHTRIIAAVKEIKKAVAA